VKIFYELFFIQMTFFQSIKFVTFFTSLQLFFEVFSFFCFLLFLTTFFCIGMVKCGFCKEEGHRITDCEKSGAAEQRAANAAKRAEKTAQKLDADLTRFSVHLEALDHHSPTPTAGRLHLDYAKECSTPDG
jgi:hypothetical protein